MRAHLHARQGIGHEGIDQTLAALREMHLEAVPNSIGGEPTLEVRGFKHEGDLLAKFIQRGWVDGNPEITKEASDHPGWRELVKQGSWKGIIQAIRDNSLQFSGASMTIADLGFTGYGLIERNWQDMGAGLSYLTGSTMLGVYGHNDQSDLQIRELAKMVLEEAKAKGLEVPENSALANAGRERRENPLKQLDNLFKKYPSEIANISYMVAGSLIAWTALQHRVLAPQRIEETAEMFAKRKSNGWGDVALGASTVTAGGIATLIKEKKVDPDQPKQKGVAGLIDWVRESPLRLAGWMYIGSTACHAWTTYGERKAALETLHDVTQTVSERDRAAHKLKAIPLRVLFIGATILGEFLMSISSKGHGEGVVSDQSVDTSVIAIAADLIVKQKPEMQEKLIDYMAGYLGGPHVLAMKNEEVTAMLRKEVELARNNPWACRQAAGPRLAEGAPAAHVPADTLPMWQAKAAAVPAAGACQRSA